MSKSSQRPALSSSQSPRYITLSLRGRRPRQVPEISVLVNPYWPTFHVNAEVLGVKFTDAHEIRPLAKDPIYPDTVTLVL